MPLVSIGLGSRGSLLPGCSAGLVALGAILAAVQRCGREGWDLTLSPAQHLPPRTLEHHGGLRGQGRLSPTAAPCAAAAHGSAPVPPIVVTREQADDSGCEGMPHPPAEPPRAHYHTPRSQCLHPHHDAVLKG
jgi:hypothetical protein